MIEDNMKRLINVESKIYNVGFLITLLVVPITLDPFVLPKYLILILGTFYIYSAHLKNSRLLEYKTPLILSLSYLTLFLIILIQFYINRLSLNQILNGSWARNLGIVTYICLITVAWLISNYSNQRSCNEFLKVLVKLNCALSFLGVLQHYFQEPLSLFFEWYNPSNAIILTLGNTNYSSSFLAFLAIVCLGVGVSKEYKHSFQRFALINFLVSSCLVFSMSDFQGKVLLIIGMFFVVGTRLNETKLEKNHKYLVVRSWWYFGIANVVLIFAATYNYGPFSQILDANLRTLQDRFLHWSIAIKIVTERPLSGIGIDNFEQGYRKYRTEKSVEFRGNAYSYADNAHNIPLQLGATGGILLLLIYTALIFFVSIILLKSKNLYSSQTIWATLLSGWIIYMLQGFISPENISFAFWGWVVAGIVVGNYRRNVYKNEREEKKLRGSELKPQNVGKLTSQKNSKILTYVSSILVLAISYQPLNSLIVETRIQSRLLSFANSSSPDELMYRTLKLVDDTKESENVKVFCRVIQNLRSSASYAGTLRPNIMEAALDLSQVAADRFPKSFCALDHLAFVLEAKGDFQRAIYYRNLILDLDPLNNISIYNLNLDKKKALE